MASVKEKSVKNLLEFLQNLVVKYSGVQADILI